VSEDNREVTRRRFLRDTLAGAVAAGKAMVEVPSILDHELVVLE
jgi:hypothetical protein